METFGTVPAGEDDPLIRAALSGKKVGQHASFDDELGGLSGRSKHPTFTRGAHFDGLIGLICFSVML